MKEIKISIKVAFESDAYLKLLYRRNGKLFYAGAWSNPTLNRENYFNDRYQMNLIETEHDFCIQLQDNDIPDYSISEVQFGFTGARDMWVGPGMLKAIPLGDLINHKK